jgi:hypothetical protein
MVALGAAWAGGLPSAERSPGPVEQEALPSTPEIAPPALERAWQVPASHTTLSAARRSTRVVPVRSSSNIPNLALAAYQRAEAVMDAADSTCRISWTLLAAVADVESDHGHHGGSRLDAEGRARPAIIGRRLDGRGNTAAIPDSDAGQYDGDRRWDRAVGPLQFIPSTWSLVAVDADGDALRDPQDIDDAALAAAVYLCSGPEDLATDAGRRVAVHRYNHSEAYVDLVLRLMQAYADGSIRFTMISAQPIALRQISPSPSPQAQLAAGHEPRHPQAQAAPAPDTAHFSPGPDDEVPGWQPGEGEPAAPALPEDQLPEGQTPEEQTPDDQTPDDQTPEETLPGDDPAIPEPEEPAAPEEPTEPPVTEPADPCVTEEPGTPEEPGAPEEPTDPDGTVVDEGVVEEDGAPEDGGVIEEAGDPGVPEDGVPEDGVPEEPPAPCTGGGDSPSEPVPAPDPEAKPESTEPVAP